jgi:hypothetical protein
MPTLLPIREPAAGLLDPVIVACRALKARAAVAGVIARGIWAEEQQAPRRSWRDFVSLREVPTTEGRRISAHEAEARSWDL